MLIRSIENVVRHLISVGNEPGFAAIWRDKVGPKWLICAAHDMGAEKLGFP